MGVHQKARKNGEIIVGVFGDLHEGWNIRCGHHLIRRHHVTLGTPALGELAARGSITPILGGGW